jgi:hypothetical protein
MPTITEFKQKSLKTPSSSAIIERLDVSANGNIE